MFSHSPNKPYHPTFHDNRSSHHTPFSRPHTPLGATNVPSIAQSRSLSKLPGPNFPSLSVHNHNPPPRNISRSRVSMGNSQSSHLSDLLNEPDVFSEQLVFLLRNQQKNINNLKEKIEREKGRVENDFSVFRAEIDHILEDVKLSVQAELDLVYKTYITKYADLKGEVQDLRLLRKEVLMSSQGPANYGNNHPLSNKDLINQIETDAEHMRNFRIFGYIGQLQKQKLEPINEIANELVLVGVTDTPFYKHKEMTSKFRDVKKSFGSLVKDVFDTLDQYVMTPANLRERDRADLENTRTVLRELDAGQSTKLRTFDNHPPSKDYNHALSKDYNEERSMGEVKSSKPKTNKLSYVGPNEQTCVTRYCEDIKLNRIERVETDHTDSILCIHFVGSNYIATGSKDTTINVYSLDGRKIRYLKGHQAAICCLAFVKGPSGDLLASGSDNGCGSVILWDIKSWQMSSKIQAHEAAVTSIVDLSDGRHIATGSYDKKINIFSMTRNQRMLSLNNRTSVTGMVMTLDKSRLVASGLDKSVSVWAIVRKNGVVEDVVSERVIPNEELVCQLQPSLIRHEIVFCACRDGTLRILNVVSGQIERSFTVNANSLIELVVIEREMSADNPVLISCSCKDSALVVTKMDNGLSSLAKVAGGLGIDYGCGIGPKIVLSEVRDGLMAIVNQRKDNREFSLFEVQLK